MLSVQQVKTGMPVKGIFHEEFPMVRVGGITIVSKLSTAIYYSLFLF